MDKGCEKRTAKKLGGTLQAHSNTTETEIKFSEKYPPENFRGPAR